MGLVLGFSRSAYESDPDIWPDRPAIGVCACTTDDITDAIALLVPCATVCLLAAYYCVNGGVHSAVHGGPEQGDSSKHGVDSVVRTVATCQQYIGRHIGRGIAASRERRLPWQHGTGGARISTNSQTLCTNKHEEPLADPRSFSGVHVTSSRCCPHSFSRLSNEMRTRHRPNVGGAVSKLEPPNRLPAPGSRDSV
jgi:hypothetical protein